MAWYTGDAWGLTATLSPSRRCPNHSDVMIEIIDADDAWWPPTLMSPAARSWLAESTMRTASHSTRRWMSSRAAERAVLSSTLVVLTPDTTGNDGRRRAPVQGTPCPSPVWRKELAVTSGIHTIRCVPGPRSEPPLDATDLAILDVLVVDARATYGDIGAEVGLSAPAVKRRMDRLASAGVIRRYTVDLDHERLGRPLEAFTELRFSGNARVDVIAAIGADIPEVQRVFTMAGDPDALVWLRVRDVRDLKRVVDRLRGAGDVTGTKTMIVLDASIRASTHGAGTNGGRGTGVVIER